MAHKKAGGSSRNGRDSQGRRLGVKRFGDETVLPGNILIRQRGTKYRAGYGVKMGRDHTLYALIEGRVTFSIRQGDQIVSVKPEMDAKANAKTGATKEA